MVRTAEQFAGARGKWQNEQRSTLLTFLKGATSGFPITLAGESFSSSICSVAEATEIVNIIAQHEITSR